MRPATVAPEAIAVAASWKRGLEMRSETNWLIVKAARMMDKRRVIRL